MLSNTLQSQIKSTLKRFLQPSPNFNTVTVTHLTALLKLLFDDNTIEENDILNLLVTDLKYRVKNRFDSKIIAVKRWSFNIFIQTVYIAIYFREIKFLNNYNLRYLETVGLQKLVIDIYCYKCSAITEIVTRYNKYPHIIFENILLECSQKGMGIMLDTIDSSTLLVCPICYSLSLRKQKYLSNSADHKMLN
jgi:hypothetical protein